jgi:tRNA threonylcarbamoyladenosine biosynthesis protein TsaB
MGSGKIMLLALDTSTSYASIAVVREQRLLAELNWFAGTRHSTDLFARLDWLLASHNLAMSDLTSVAVTTGPGSFNGLRVAVTAAKSLCFALGSPLYACSTLDVIGWSGIVSGCVGPFTSAWALLDAGRGQIYAAQYRESPVDQPFAPLDGHQVLTAGELAERIAAVPEQTAFFSGEWIPATQATLTALLGARAAFGSPLPTRRASWLADLALRQMRRAEAPADIMSLEPLYLRRPAITKSSKFALPSGVVEAGRQGNGAESRAQRGGEEASHAVRR